MDEFGHCRSMRSLIFLPSHADSLYQDSDFGVNLVSKMCPFGKRAQHQFFSAGMAQW